MVTSGNHNRASLNHDFRGYPAAQAAGRAAATGHPRRTSLDRLLEALGPPGRQGGYDKDAVLETPLLCFFSAIRGDA